MISGALWAHCWGLALADFGRDLRGSDSLRGSRNFLKCQINNERTISPISRRTNFTTFEHNNVDRWRYVNFWNRILKILSWGVIFPEKRKNCSQNFQVLRLQVVITTQWLQIAGNLLPNDPPTGHVCLVSILPLESIQSLSPTLYAPYKERTFHIFGNVRCPILGKPRTPLQLHGCQHKVK